MSSMPPSTKKESGPAVCESETSNIEGLGSLSHGADASVYLPHESEDSGDKGDVSSASSCADDGINPHDSSVSHQWNQEAVRNILATSFKTIKLNPSCEKTRHRPLTVHKELLCHYSRYYHAALKGQFSEARKDNFKVDTDYETLSLFIGWIYTGKFEKSVRSFHLVRLYILADGKEVLALRRKVLQELQSKVKIGSLVTYASVSEAYQCLPDSSPLLDFIIQAYINHFHPGFDTKQGVDVSNNPKARAYKPTIESTPAQFFYKVLIGQSTFLHPTSPNFVKPPCDCCHNICKFHEHGNDSERRETCGPSNLEILQREEVEKRRILAEHEKRKAAAVQSHGHRSRNR